MLATRWNSTRLSVVIFWPVVLRRRPRSADSRSTGSPAAARTARRRDRASPAWRARPGGTAAPSRSRGSRTPRRNPRSTLRGSRMIGTIASSSMSSSAREVRFGSPPGIGLLMKWITCAFSARLADRGGRAPRLRLREPEALRHAVGERAAPCSPSRSSRLRASLIVAGSVALRKNIAAAVPGLNFFLPCWRSRLRIAIDTSPKSMSTGHGFSHLWQTVQWSATSPNSSKWRRRHAAPRLLLVQERLDQQRGGEDLVARASRAGWRAARASRTPACTCRSAGSP